MASVSVFCALMANAVFLQTCDAQQEIRARLGENITLPCQAPINQHFIAVEWTRPDLNPDIVFFNIEGQIYDSQQHPFFHNRVDLLETRLNTNVSLVLRNVTANDSGTYECRVKEEEEVRVRRSVIKSPPISTITLTVLPDVEPEKNKEKDSHVWIIASSSVAAFVVLLIVGLVVGITYRRKTQQSYTPPVAQTAETVV